MNLLLENDILLPSKQVLEGNSMAQKRLEDMTKEELIAKQRKANNSEASKARFPSTVLTIPEGKIFQEMLDKYGCTNPSQFAKKIVRGELILFENTDPNNLKM